MIVNVNVSNLWIKCMYNLVFFIMGVLLSNQVMGIFKTFIPILFKLL